MWLHIQRNIRLHIWLDIWRIWDTSPSDRIQHLEKIEMTREGAIWIVKYLEEFGCACDQWGVHSRITQLMNGLHTKAWSRGLKHAQHASSIA